MSAPSLIHDPKVGGDVEARLDFGAEGLTVFDPNGRKLQHWPYPEIMHAHPPGAWRNAILSHPSRPEIHLNVRDDAVYDSIRERAPQLRRPRRGWRMFFAVLGGMPHEPQVGMFVLAGAAVCAIYGFFAGWFG